MPTLLFSYLWTCKHATSSFSYAFFLCVFYSFTPGFNVLLLFTGLRQSWILDMMNEKFWARQLGSPSPPLPRTCKHVSLLLVFYMPSANLNLLPLFMWLRQSWTLNMINDMFCAREFADLSLPFPITCKHATCSHSFIYLSCVPQTSCSVSSECPMNQYIILSPTERITSPSPYIKPDYTLALPVMLTSRNCCNHPQHGRIMADFTLNVPAANVRTNNEPHAAPDVVEIRERKK